MLKLDGTQSEAKVRDKNENSGDKAIEGNASSPPLAYTGVLSAV